MSIHRRFAPLMAIFAVAACLVLAGTSSAFAATSDADEPGSGFNGVVEEYYDVANPSSWYYASVYRAAMAEIMVGYGQGEFGSGNVLNRAQAVVVMWRLLAPEEAAAYPDEGVANETTMQDVEDGMYYTGAVNWAVKHGVVSGKSETVFDPYGDVTREQLCTIMANAFAGENADIDTSALDAMPDADQVSTWAYSSVAWALNMGVISGSQTNGQRYVIPRDSVSRPMMAAIQMNATDKGIVSLGNATTTNFLVFSNNGCTWINGEGELARSQLLTPYEFGYWAYVSVEGYVVTDRYTDPTTGTTYLADGSGQLEEPGWLVTDVYGQGTVRYYIDERAHGCVYGYSEAGYPHFTTEEGYVSTGMYTTKYGVVFSDDRGKLKTANMKAGWYDGTALTGKLDRFFLREIGGCLYAATGLFEEVYGGSLCLFYGGEDGAVVRDRSSLVIDGTFYSVDSEGRLTKKKMEDNSDPIQGEDDGSSAAGYRDPTLATVTWSNSAAYLNRMRSYANIYGSYTDYFIAADWTNCRVTILRRNGDGWDVIKTWNGNFGYSGVGNNDTHTIKHKSICNWADEYFWGEGSGPNDWNYNDWSTCYIESYSDSSYGHLRYVDGLGYEDCASIHSTNEEETGYANRGCIGLQYYEAKWVYDVIPVGTNLYLFT